MTISTWLEAIDLAFFLDGRFGSHAAATWLTRALLIGCLVGDFYHLEWGYWLAILAICYTKLYGRANYGVVPEVEVTPAQAEQGDADLLKELALENT